MENLLLIPIQRFISGRKLSCDVFLHLPLNKKTIVVALAGQEVPEDFLKKIQAKGYSHLGVSKNSALGIDPNTFPLYEEGEPTEIPAAENLEVLKEEISTEKEEEKAITAEAITAEAITAEPITAPTPTPASTDSPELGSIKTPSTKEKKKTTLTVVPKPAEETNSIAASVADPTDKTTLSATKQPDLEKTKIKSGPKEVEPTTALKTDVGAPLEEQKFSNTETPEVLTKVSGKNKKMAAEPESHFSQEKEEEVLNRVKGSKAEEEVESRVKSSKAEKEKISLVKGKVGEINEEERSFSADEEDPETVNRFSGEKEEEKEPPVTIFGSKDENDDSVVFRLGRRVEEAKESLISGKKVDLTKDKELFLAGAEATLLSSKISEHIIKLSEETKKAKPQERVSLRSQMRNFHSALQKAEKGEEVPAEIKEALSITEDLASLKKDLAKKDETEQVIELSDRLSDLMEKRELATQAVEEEEQKEAARKESPEKEDSKEKDKNKKQEHKNRELPSTVSRLAAYLGYSLGYSDVNFLSDLSFGAIMQITYSETALPKDLDPSAIPELVKSWKSENPNSVLDDTRSIMNFLQIYLNDPECDLSQKDFARKVFDRSVAQLMKEKTVNSWDLGKWSSFMERGLTMESHSICTRASAKALKKTRSIFN